MQVVLLAGGLGSRLSEETVSIPKPMVEISGRPIILHVMDIYSQWGHKDFIVACGYKSFMMKKFFHDLYFMGNDFTVAVHDGNVALHPSRPMDWNVSVVDTGQHTMTGGRLRRLREWLGNETFMVTYSDGVGNIDIEALIAFHRSHGGLATVTAVQPPARFGNLEIVDNQVIEFTEKVLKQETWINGGFFVFEPGVLDYLSGDDEPLEQAPLAALARDGELFAYKHTGFWHPMDTVRDRDHLNQLCVSGDIPWMTMPPLEAVELPRQAFATNV
jgi:glucose-1-phosphate cytidylyltransferase